MKSNFELNSITYTTYSFRHSVIVRRVLLFCTKSFMMTWVFMHAALLALATAVAACYFR